MRDDRPVLKEAYEDLAVLATSLDEDSSWLPTGCAGWSVRDLVVHHLADARRGLVALATPAAAPVDRDAYSYWSDFANVPDPYSRGLRASRTVASAWTLPAIVTIYAETLAAVGVTVERVLPDDLVATQGHVLTVADLVTTLVVEAAVHHLDLVVVLDRPGPRPEAMAVVRETLNGMLGHPPAIDWDDPTWAQVGTGRRRLDDDERAALGTDAARLPLFR